VELSELREELRKKEKDLSELEFLFHENEMEMKVRTEEIERAEQRLAGLRGRLVEGKKKIRRRFRELSKLNERAVPEKLNSQEAELRAEMNKQMSFWERDLLNVETSNAAMEEGLRKETEILVAKARKAARAEYERLEHEELTNLMKAEDDGRAAMISIISSYDDAYDKLATDLRERADGEARIFMDGIESLRASCEEERAIQATKRSEMIMIESRSCETCPVMKSKLRVIKKQLVGLQMDDRQIGLLNKNRRELVALCGTHD
jgi:hypothetical protein